MRYHHWIKLFLRFTINFFIFLLLGLHLPTTADVVSSGGSFFDFIQARDAVGLKTFMTNEIQLQNSHHLERNNLAMFEAVCDGAAELCEVLISFGADVNYTGGRQGTPLFLACWYAHPACVDLLLAHGANVNTVNLSHSWTPLIGTAVKNDTPIGLTLDQFIDKRCQCMRSLLAGVVAIDQTDKHGYSAVMCASWCLQLTEILVEAGANINILNLNLINALHIATVRKNADVVEMLLKRGADVDALTDDRVAPLLWVCRNLVPVIVESLLRHNADIDIVDNFGRTPLQCVLVCPVTSPNRVAVLQLMATCAQTRLEASSADWIRLAGNEQHGHIL